MMELRLRPYHEVSGALFRPESGWDVPSSYGPLSPEVRSVRSSAGLIDLSDRAKIRVRGADRVSFLDGLLTADVKALTPGASAYALLLTDKSRVVGDLRIYAFEDRFVLDIEAAQKEAVLTSINKFLVSDDVVLEDLGACGHIEVHGPASARLLSTPGLLDVRSLSLDAFTFFQVDKHHVGYAGRIRSLGEVGFAVWSPGAGLENLWADLTRRGVTPFGRDAYDVLRIEAGVPRVGVDMGLNTLALEVAPEGAISFTKGCYVGQEVVARGTYRGHMNRRLLGLKVTVDVPPSHADVVRKEDEVVGTVTSAAWSPTKGWVIALAILRVEEVTPDSNLFIDHGGWDLRAKLHPLPFVRGSA